MTHRKSLSRFSHLAILAALPLLLPSTMHPAATPVSPAPFEVLEPQIPERSATITRFGAVADGHALNTAAFAAAIDSLAEQGGGRVIVPPGLWLTGPIVLKSRIELHLERGALIQFSDNRDDYPLESNLEGRTVWRCQAPISGTGLEHVAITGPGTIDGAGQAWRPVKREKLTARQWDELVRSGGVVDARERTWYPSAASLEGNEKRRDYENAGREMVAPVRDSLRPVLVSLANCRFVKLEGPTFQNSPAWNIHPLLCEHLTVRGITVRNPWFSQNGDGIDPESCRNVLIEDSTFDVGDDAICLKSGRDAAGRARGKPTENVIVRNCTVYHGHGGFVVGSEMSGGVRNVHVSNCTFTGTDTGLRFKSTRGRGGAVENILIEDVRMTGIPNEAILFDLFYGGQAPGERDELSAAGGATAVPPVTEETPAFRNITMRGIVCHGSGRAALMRGLPEMPLHNILLENATLSGGAGILAMDVDGLALEGVRVKAADGPSLVLRNGRNVAIGLLSPEEGTAPHVEIEGGQTEAVSLGKPDGLTFRLTVAPEVPAGTVKVQSDL